jgi:hypothetical protein
MRFGLSPRFAAVASVKFAARPLFGPQCVNPNQQDRCILENTHGAGILELLTAETTDPRAAGGINVPDAIPNDQTLRVFKLRLLSCWQRRKQIRIRFRFLDPSRPQRPPLGLGEGFQEATTFGSPAGAFRHLAIAFALMSIGGYGRGLRSRVFRLPRNSLNASLSCMSAAVSIAVQHKGNGSILAVA